MKIQVLESYPSTWGKIGETEQGACYNPFCALTIVSRGSSNDQFGFALAKFPKEDCNCNSLMDFVEYTYAAQKSTTGFTFIDDNKTVIDKKYPAWQYVYTYLQDGVQANGLVVLTKINETFYTIGITFPDELKVKLLPEFRKLIDSVRFLPRATALVQLLAYLF